MAAIAVRITSRAGITSSAGTALVSHEYPPHAHHNTTSSPAPCNIPTQVRWACKKAGDLGEGEDEDQVEKQFQGCDAPLGEIPALRRHRRWSRRAHPMPSYSLPIFAPM